MSPQRQASAAHRANSSRNLADPEGAAAAPSGSLQHMNSAGRLQHGWLEDTSSSVKKAKPVCMRSASSLAASLISSLTAAAPVGPSATAEGRSVVPETKSTASGTLPAINSNRSGTAGSSAAVAATNSNVTGAFSQAAVLAATSSRPPSESALRPSRSPSVLPAASGTCTPLCSLTPASSCKSLLASFTDPGTSQSNAGQASKSGPQQLTALEQYGGSYSLEGGRCLLFKEAAVKYVDPEAPASACASHTGHLGASSSAGVVQAGTGSRAGGRADAERPTMSFNPSNQVSLFDWEGSTAASQQDSSGMSSSSGSNYSTSGGGSSSCSSSGAGASKGLKGGLAAIKSKFKQLALVLESGPDHDSQGSSSTEITPPSLPATLNPSSEGGSGSGGSASQQHALEYKWQHGYLPTPSASSAGHISRKGSFVVPLSRASSSKLTDTAIAATGDAAAAAAGDAAADSSLPAGAVPVFGPAGQLSTGSSASTCSKHTAPASVSGPQGAQSNSRVNSNATEVSSGVSSMPAVTLKAPGQIRLGPASLPGPLLLAVSSWLPPAMQRDHWCLSDFVVMKKLYEGYASSICKARDSKSGTIVALKMYRMHKLNDISSHQVAREVRLHVALQHENIIGLYAAWQEAGNVVLLQEYAGQGDLWAFIDSNGGRLPERVTVSLVLQPFLRALQFLHSSGIMHRDIKPENVLFGSNMVLKLADFGLALNLREETAVTRVGTLDYMAPETLRCPLKRQPGDNKDRTDLAYSTAVDAWAVGVLAFELLTGRAPFTGSSDTATQYAISTATPTLPARMSEPAKQFIIAALNKSSAARPTILQMLKHPWVTSFQRSCSNSRAEQRSSLDLGGTGRLLLVIPADADSGLDSSSGGIALSQRPAASASLAVSSPSRSSSMSSSNAAGAQARADGPQKPALATAGVGSSSRNERVPAGAVQSSAAHSKLYAAAARVWNSDDNGLTGYASMDSCL